MDFRTLGKQVSNWGRWGTDDRIGTLNYITAERVVEAGRLMRTGRLFDLGLSIQTLGIQPVGGVRPNPLHTMTLTALDFLNHPDNGIINDDCIHMHLQSVTQCDGLAHFGYDGYLYNGFKVESVSTLHGSSKLSIDQIAL